jgi:hypothetical protein
LDTITSLVPELFNWIPIFRTGTHIDSQGQEDTWKDDDLDKLMANFQPNTFSVPIVLGHQTADYSPAQGWVAALKKQGGILYAKLANVLENFAISFKNKQYPNRSVGIDMTDQGPVLRHLAFLGAVPPAIDLPPVLQFKRYLSTHVYSLPLDLITPETTTCDADMTTAGTVFIECGGATDNPNVVSNAVSQLTSAIATLAEITPSLQSLKQSLLTGDTPMLATYAASTGTTGSTATSGDTGATATTEMAAPPFPPKSKSTTDATGTTATSGTTEMAAPTMEYELPIATAPTQPPTMPSMQPPPVIPQGMVLMTQAERQALLSQSIASASDALFSTAKLFINKLQSEGKLFPAIIDELADFICYLEKQDSPNPILAYAAQNGLTNRKFTYTDHNSGRRVEMRPADFFRYFLSSLPQQVQVGRQGHDYSAAAPASSPQFQPNPANTAFIVSEVLKQIHGGN